jgi:hypothetical protein
MEIAYASGNSQKLFQIVRKTGPRRLDVSQLISKKDGSNINNIKCLLGRWAEQFSWLRAQITEPEYQSVHEIRAVTTGPPSHTELYQAIQDLCGNKASGPNEISSALFKDSCETLLAWFGRPESWKESMVILILKKGVRSARENQREISLTPIISKILASIILNRLTPFRGR